MIILRSIQRCLSLSSIASSGHHKSKWLLLLYINTALAFACVVAKKVFSVIGSFMLCPVNENVVETLQLPEIVCIACSSCFLVFVLSGVPIPSTA